MSRRDQQIGATIKTSVNTSEALQALEENINLLQGVHGGLQGEDRAFIDEAIADLLEAREEILSIGGINSGRADSGRNESDPQPNTERRETTRTNAESGSYDTIRILKQGPANPVEVVHLVETLSYEELRRQHLIEKYGRGFVGRFKAFIAGELDSEKIDGCQAQKAWWESESIRQVLVSVFNKKNAYAAGAAIAVGVLTGGIGAPAVGVLLGGSAGRYAAELFASKHEGEARSGLMQAEREHWQKLQELAAQYRREREDEAKKTRLTTLLNEYFAVNEASVTRQQLETAANNLEAVTQRWNGIRNICQNLGAMAGLGGGLLYGHVIGHFSGIDTDLWSKAAGQKVFHSVDKINGIWHFAGKAGEVVGSGTVPSGQVVYHVMDYLNPAASGVAAKIYTAAAAKALPTLGALCLVGIKKPKFDFENNNPFTYYNPSWKKKREQYSRTRAGQEAVAPPKDATLETEARAREALPQIIDRETTLDDSDTNDFRLSRRAAMIILGRIKRYAELNADTPEERERLFIEKAREYLKHEIVVHHRGPKREDESDLDGETALYLLRQAVGGDIEVFYEPQGKFREGHLNIDTGERHGIAFEPAEIKNGVIPETAFIDHHGKETWTDLSAAELTYETLISLGLLERSERLDKLVRFVTDADNMTGPFRDAAAFERSHRSLVGLYRMMKQDKIVDFFMNNENPDPTRELSDEELRTYGLISQGIDGRERNKSKAQRRSIEQAKRVISRLESEGKVMITPYGKALIDEGGQLRIQEAAFAAGYSVIIKYDDKGIFISGMPRELSLPEGKRIRNMWMHRRKPTIPLDDIIAVFARRRPQPRQMARAV